MHAGTPAVVVEIVDVSGSAPRDIGTAMIVADDEISGTVGGGALEWALIAAAREMLMGTDNHRDVEQALGPEIGQCCGGKVRAFLTRLTGATLDDLSAASPQPSVCIFGAGHVGAALAQALAPLPLSVEIFDERAALLTPLARFGQIVETALPEAQVAAAPPNAAYVITTHDHALDFHIAEAAIRRGDAAYVGMIGSTSKRAVLARRLAQAGLSDASLICPIGASDTHNKHPAIIAAMTAAELVGVLFSE